MTTQSRRLVAFGLATCFVGVPSYVTIHQASRSDSKKSYDVTVVGAGIVGTSAALFAKRANPAAKVLLVDAEAVAAGTSPHSAGTVWVAQRLTVKDKGSVTPTWDEVLSSATVDVYRDLEEEGFDCELDETGAVLVAGSQKEAKYVANVFLDLATRGFSIAPSKEITSSTSSPLDQSSCHYVREGLELVSEPSALRAIEPRLFHESEGGKVVLAMHLPASVQVEPNMATLSMAQAAEESGVIIRNGFELSSLRGTPRGSGWQLISSTGDAIETDKVVIACGINATRVFPNAKIVPVKGQIVQSSEALPRGFLSKIIFSASAHADFALGLAGKSSAEIPAECTHDAEGRGYTRHLYGRQKRDGHVIMGGGRVPQVGYAQSKAKLDYKVDLELMHDVVNHAKELIKEDDRRMNMDNAVAENSWSCYMPWSLDSRPFLGEVKSQPGLYLAVGFGPEGMTWGPAAGKILAEQIWNKPGFFSVPFGEIVLNALQCERS